MKLTSQQKRKVVSAFTAATALVWMTSLTACSGVSETSSDFIAVCKDPVTGKRVENDKCKDDKDTPASSKTGSTVPYWVYLPIMQSGTSHAPAVGESVPQQYTPTRPTKGSAVVPGPQGKSYTATGSKGSSNTSGSKNSGVSKGGFGSGSKGSSSS